MSNDFRWQVEIFVIWHSHFLYRVYLCTLISEDKIFSKITIKFSKSIFIYMDGYIKWIFKIWFDAAKIGRWQPKEFKRNFIFGIFYQKLVYSKLIARFARVVIIKPTFVGVERFHLVVVSVFTKMQFEVDWNHAKIKPNRN